MLDWLQVLFGAADWLPVLVWVIAVAAMLYFLVKGIVRFWPWLKRAIALVDALGQLPQFITRTDESIEQIHHEVHLNNGSSVKDAVGRVEQGVKGLHGRVDSVDGRLERIDERLDSLHEVDDELKEQIAEIPRD